MNTLRETWTPLALRIRGLEAAFYQLSQGEEFFVRLRSGMRPDELDPNRLIPDMFVPALRECYDDVVSFCDHNRVVLQSAVIRCLERFKESAKFIKKEAPTPRFQLQVIAAFSALRVELDYYFSDRESQMIKLVERAFSHLRRRIVADPDFAKQWQTSYHKKSINKRSVGEAACEQLGAVHLLQHGIWSFKATSERERTDLVLGVSLDMQEVERSADALILTEWKKFNDKRFKSNNRESQIQKIAESAVKQAKIYSQSSLAGYEIRSIRYIPIVTEDRVAVNDIDEDGIKYRVINIPVDPESPSKAKSE